MDESANQIESHGFPESVPAAAPVKTDAATQIAAAHQQLLDAHYEKVRSLTPEQRSQFFYENKTEQDLKVVNLLSAKVDRIRDPKERRAFFVAHPELVVRYSHANFKPLTA